MPTEKYQESLKMAIKSLQLGDHMAYVTYPIIKDKRLLLKVLEQIYDTLLHTINSILQYDYLWKKVILYKDPKSNFQVFREKCAPRYGISTQDVRQILEILSLVEKHKKSPLEFARKDKVIIMADNLKTEIIDLEKVKSYLVLSKILLQKASAVIYRH